MDNEMYRFVKYLHDVPRKITDKIGKSIDKDLEKVRQESTIQENLAYKEAATIILNS